MSLPVVRRILMLPFLCSARQPPYIQWTCDLPCLALQNETGHRSDDVLVFLLFTIAMLQENGASTYKSHGFHISIHSEYGDMFKTVSNDALPGNYLFHIDISFILKRQPRFPALQSCT